MESPQPAFEEPVKKSRIPYIIAVVALVLCCCCFVLVIAGYFFYSRDSVQGVPEQPFEDVVPTLPGDSQLPVPTEEYFAPLGEAPQGGLGNDILRNDTWVWVASSAQGQGCDQPLGEETTIEVLQEPQDGVWVEKWTVACASGDTYAYEIEFILDDTGTTFNIKSLP